MKYMERLTHHRPESRENRDHHIELQLDGKTIGYAYMSYYSRPLPDYFIQELDIDKENRGQGYGSQIMEFIEHHLRERGAAGLLYDGIQPESGAAGMYARRGWVPVGSAKGPGPQAYAFNLPSGFDLSRMDMAINTIRR